MNVSKELIALLILVLVIFGPTQLPKLAKTFGKSAKTLKDGLDGKLDDEETAAPTVPPARTELPAKDPDKPEA